MATLKEDICLLASSNKNTNELDFAKAYLTDRLVFGEDTEDIYSSVYGELMNEDYTELFESVEDNLFELTLSEDDSDKKFFSELLKRGNQTAGDTKLSNELAYMMKNRGFNGKGFSGTDIINRASADWSAKMKAENPGFLAKIGNFFKSIKNGFVGTKAFDFLKKGFSWIINPANLPVVAGSAAGLGVLYAIVKALKNKGRNKDAERIEAAIKKAKKEAK